MRNNKLVRFGSVVMCAIMVACNLAACGSVNADSSVIVEEEINSEAEDQVSDAIAKEIGFTAKSSAKTDTKEETIYVFTDASGSQNQVLVNEKLKNVSGYDSIEDVTTLKDIVNLTGDEEFTTGSNDSITWKAAGNDITYRGTTDKEMPVTMKVTYYLDDKEIAPEDLAGKSGKVRIRFDYTNNEKRTITANGKTREAYVPFTVVTGMLLSNDNFYNIEVENGKVTETGNGNMVIGIVMPGLKDSLNLTFDDEELDIDIPDYFEVTADAVDFELDMIMSMATSSILADVDFDDIDLDDLNESMDDLKDATSELIDGTKELQDGTQELQDNMPDLDEGVEDLNNGAEELLVGAQRVHEGAGTLGEGIYKLSDSVEKQVVPGVAALSSGAKQVSDGVNQLATTINGMGASIQEAKNGVIAQANAGLAANAELTAAAGTTVTMDNIDDVMSAFKEQRTQAAAYLQYSDQEACIAAIMQAQGCTQDEAVAVYSALYAAGDVAAITQYAAAFRNGVQSGIDSLDAAIETLSSVKSQVAGAIASLDGVAAQLSGNDSAESLKALTEGAAQVSEGMAQLQTSIGTFDENEIDAVIESGNETICSGLYKLKDGADQLSSGTRDLRNGCRDLKDGTQELRDSANDLIDGVGELNDGAIELKDGVKEYDEDGIQKLTRLVDDDANDCLDTLKEVIKLGKDYKSFAGKQDSWDGSVVFIYRTEGISAE